MARRGNAGALRCSDHRVGVGWRVWLLGALPSTGCTMRVRLFNEQQSVVPILL